ncbi:MAG: DUF4198 domain-containing protein [Deltaproteobacteria bacterium]|jgi:uncharacterized GH25 family protein|nr:DUF4198 domain-containing protein [Deltaproteobacteria bacterium]
MPKNLMTKIVRLTLSLALTLIASAAQLAQAHDMWATAEKPAVGEPLTALVGYGHNFPAFEAIDDAELPFFKISVLGPAGPLALKPGSPNYRFESGSPAVKGTYLVISDVAPIFWTKTPSGWSMKPKNESPGGLECGHYIESAKGVVAVGGDVSAELATKPTGLPIELVPAVHPGTVKPGDKLVLQALLNGRPLAGAKVEAKFGAFAAQASPSALAFSDLTDQDGRVGFVPLVAGDWLVAVTSEAPFADPARCDKVAYGSTLFFSVAP